MSGLEIALRTSTVFPYLLLMVVFLFCRRSDHLPVIGAALAASIAAFVVSSASGADIWLGTAHWPVTVLCHLKAVLLWLFARAAFSDRFRLSAVDRMAVLVSAAIGLWHEIALTSSWHGAALWLPTLSIGALSLTFVALTPLALMRDQRLDLDARRRRIRRRVLPLVSGYLGALIVWQSIAYLLQWSTSTVLVHANLLILLATGLAVLFSFVRIDMIEWLPARGPLSEPQFSATEQAVFDRLRQMMETPRWYAMTGLSIAQLSRLLATNEQTLRTVINGGLGHRNFNDFLHHYRLTEVAARLRTVADRQRPILTLALEAGYASIGPFNRAFRERYGVTPTAYRQQARLHSAPPAETDGLSAVKHSAR